MNYETIFFGVNLLAMAGWLVLIASPWMPVWSDRIAGCAIPVMLASIYVATVVFLPANSGGFGNFADVTELFSNPQALMAGWIHFLAFDLVVGAWICRKARMADIRFWFALPCLPITFLFGPAGFLLFTAILGGNSILKERSLAS